MSQFFTADMHLWHANIIKYCKRPFNTVQEMHEILIKNWNEEVPVNGTVYHLGDLGFASRSLLESMVHRLNGMIYLINGNHDKPKSIPRDIPGKLINLGHYHELKIYDEEMDLKQFIVLFHYPIEVWNKAHHGAWHLHGHCHGTLATKRPGRLDVGVDSHDFTPISYEDVKRHITRQVFKPVDHHGRDRNGDR
jgi:calcineurin-like phosphoesterase family protein